MMVLASQRCSGASRLKTPLSTAVRPAHASPCHASTHPPRAPAGRGHHLHALQLPAGRQHAQDARGPGAWAAHAPRSPGLERAHFTLSHPLCTLSRVGPGARLGVVAGTSGVQEGGFACQWAGLQRAPPSPPRSTSSLVAAHPSQLQTQPPGPSPHSPPARPCAAGEVGQRDRHF